MAKRKTARAPRVRRARPLLLVAAGVSLLGVEGCQHIIGNPGCPPLQCEAQTFDLAVPSQQDMAPLADGGEPAP